VALHNFIITYDPSEISQCEVKTELDLGDDDDNNWSVYQAAIRPSEQNRAAKRRDDMALEMWEAYNARPSLRCM
jgi:hypothetical protein